MDIFSIDRTKLARQTNSRPSNRHTNLPTRRQLQLHPYILLTGSIYLLSGTGLEFKSFNIALVICLIVSIILSCDGSLAMD